MSPVRLHSSHDGGWHLDTKPLINEPSRFINGVARLLENRSPFFVGLREELPRVGVIAHHKVGGHATVGRRGKTVLAHVWIPKLL